MVWSNIGHFFNVFLGNIRKKNVPYVIVEGKKATKTRSEKSGKFKIFAKELVHGVGPNLAIFPSSYFRQYRPGKSILPYCRKKKRLFRLEKKLTKWRFKIYPKLLVHGFGPKLAIYSIFLF